MRQSGRTTLALGAALLVAIGATACASTSTSGSGPAAGPSQPLAAPPVRSDPPQSSAPGRAGGPSPAETPPTRAEAVTWYVQSLRSADTLQVLARWSDSELVDLGDGFCTRVRKDGNFATATKWLADQGADVKQGPLILPMAVDRHSLCPDQSGPFKVWFRAGMPGAAWG